VASCSPGIGLVLVATQGGWWDRCHEASVRCDDPAGADHERPRFRRHRGGRRWLTLPSRDWFLLALGQGLLTPTLASAVAGMAPDGREWRSASSSRREVSPGWSAPIIGGALFAAAIPLPYIVAAGLTLIALPIAPRLGLPESVSS
jgi:hypothetical protein